MKVKAKPEFFLAARNGDMGRVLAIDLRHLLQVCRGLGRRLIVVARSTQAQQFALLTHAEHRIPGIDPRTLALSWQLLASSVLSRPICS